MKASVKPETSAGCSALPAATLSLVRVVAIVDRIAIPSAPPICCDVLIRPEASPASDGWTPASAAIEIGTNEKPIPSATSRKPGSRSPRYVPCTETCVKYTSPPVRATIPITSTGLTPSRVTSCAATIEVRIAVPATARYPTPVFSGEYPSTCCMYSVSIRNIENSAVPMMKPATLAPATVFVRSRPNRISGSGCRCSQTAKPRAARRIRRRSPASSPSPSRCCPPA